MDDGEVIEAFLDGGPGRRSGRRCTSRATRCSSLLGGGAGGAGESGEAGGTSVFDMLGELGQQFLEMVAAGHEQVAVTDVHTAG